MANEETKAPADAVAEDFEARTNGVMNEDLQRAIDAGNAWQHDGKTYAKYIVNGTAGVGATMTHPVEKTRPIAILGADFLWEGDEVFIDHLNLAIRDERNVRDDESQRKRKNITAQNAGLFHETVQRGWLVKIDEDGTKSERIDKTREQMLNYAPEIQSDIINAWLGKFTVERYFPNGTDDVDSLLSEPESVQFLCKVGEFKNPAHVFILEFNTPSSEQRNAYADDTLIAGTRTEGDTVISNYMINNKAKIRFFRKHFRKVIDGVALAPAATLDFDDAEIQPVTDNKVDLDRFKKEFCPHWQVIIADKLSDCFDFGGK